MGCQLSRTNMTSAKTWQELCDIVEDVNKGFLDELSYWRNKQDQDVENKELKAFYMNFRGWEIEKGLLKGKKYDGRVAQAAENLYVLLEGNKNEANGQASVAKLKEIHELLARLEPLPTQTSQSQQPNTQSNQQNQTPGGPTQGQQPSGNPSQQ